MKKSNLKNINLKSLRMKGLSGGKRFGPPPLKGPNPIVPPVKFGLGGIGCQYRRGGKTDIQGVSKIQLKGKKFIGVK